MAYRNKTFISFASEDLSQYYLMKAWRANQHIDFDFYDAHDLNTARDTSQPETIKIRLRERLSNAKQIILLVGDETKRKAADSSTFIFYEVEVIKSLSLPIVFVHLNQNRESQSSRVPSSLRAPLYTISTSFQPKIVKYALDDFPSDYENYPDREGVYHYTDILYKSLGL